jgi:DNA invertase Pin-like site-specific DNA recombinase
MKLVIYYRVSTRKQKVSGLGLDAQCEAAEAYAKLSRGTVVATFTETESGKRSDRPELQKAVAKARAIRGRLVIAKLDRLARNVFFIAGLMESKVDFVCCDNPHATPLTIHLIAAFAEDEAKRISQRTKEALKAAKRKGKLLGTHNPQCQINWRKGQRNGLGKAVAAASASRRELRDACYSELIADAVTMRKDGLSYAAIAAALNNAGHVTTSGKQFAAMTVQRLLTAC